MGLADFSNISSINSTRPLSFIFDEISNATAPATCGPAILVPLKLAYPLFLIHDRTPTPGAAILGLMRLEPSIKIGPQLLKEAMVSFCLIAPTLNAFSDIAGTVLILPHCPPSFPAETTTTIPACFNRSMASVIV